MTISSYSSDSNYSASAGDIFSLTCSATIYIDDLPSDAGAPTFRWYFGTNDNASLPSGMTSMATVLSGNNHLHQYSAVISTESVSCREVHITLGLKDWQRVLILL